MPAITDQLCKSMSQYTGLSLTTTRSTVYTLRAAAQLTTAVTLAAFGLTEFFCGDIAEVQIRGLTSNSYSLKFQLGSYDAYGYMESFNDTLDRKLGSFSSVPKVFSGAVLLLLSANFAHGAYQDAKIALNPGKKIFPIFPMPK